jgi:aryl-alcohol dehydrogenase-like predicted oxidoreductase
MRRTRLGNLDVSAQGLGCLGMSEQYGPTDWDQSIATLERAPELGVTLLDTADIYGSGHNEVLVGRGIHGRREQVQIATKFGIDRSGGDDAVRLRGEPGYVRRACDASLLRLGIERIDIFYLHRPPENCEIEETIGAMAELVEAGKVGAIGLSEVDEPTLRRAHAVHPIAAVESEYSLWTREVEALAPALAELGAGLVAYAPLGRGYLTGSVSPRTLSPGDYRLTSPRFQEEANQTIAATVREVAAEVGATPAQVALAWVHDGTERLGIPVVPIPGTRRRERLEENAAAADLRLDAAALARLEPLADLVVGARYAAGSIGSDD